MGAQAKGDPHLRNVHGQTFDIMQPGKHTLIHIPLRADIRDTLLHVDGSVARLGAKCADMYFRQVNITGAWAEAKRSGGLQYHADALPPRDEGGGARWVSLGTLTIKVVHGNTLDGIRYLNFYVRHLGSTRYAVGGLLGEDDHTKAAAPGPRCRNPLL